MTNTDFYKTHKATIQFLGAVFVAVVVQLAILLWYHHRTEVSLEDLEHDSITNIMGQLDDRIQAEVCGRYVTEEDVLYQEFIDFGIRVNRSTWEEAMDESCEDHLIP
jgi:hypothetical protein